MFGLSAKKNLDSKEFIDFYMQSNTARFFDLPYDRTQWLGEENLLYDVLEENQNLAYHTLDCAQAIERILEA